MDNFLVPKWDWWLYPLADVITTSADVRKFQKERILKNAVSQYIKM